MIPHSKKEKRKGVIINFIIFFFFVLAIGIGISQSIKTPFSIDYFTKNLTTSLLQVWKWKWNDNTLKVIIVFSIIYFLFVLNYFSTPQNFRYDEEHGSANWIDPKSFNKIFKGGKKEGNFILSEKCRLGMDMFRHQLNLSAVVIGGSGAGKSRAFVVPNLLQANSSFVVTDPKGEILKSLGWIFKNIFKYKIKVLNLIEPSKSDRFNPFLYIKSEEDIISLITNLIQNTTPPESRSSDPFWEKAELFLMSSICMFLWESVPVEEQNFTSVLKLLNTATAKEDGETSVLEIIFQEYEKTNPKSVAVFLYNTFKEHAKGKTLQSILITCSSRIIHFALPKIATMTNEDDMDFQSMATQKTIIFCVIPDDDTSFNHIVGMLYTSYFQSMYRLSYEKYNSSRLPIHQRVILDEFANIALPDRFLNLLGTLRSRNISASIIVQNLEQFKKLYKEQWENVIGLCDSLIFLGSNQTDTNEYITKMLGPETINKKNFSISRGGKGGGSTTFDKMQRELLKPDEIRRLNRKYSLIILSNTPSVFDKKFNLKKHEWYKKTGFYKRCFLYHHEPIRSQKITNESKTFQKSIYLDSNIINIKF